MLSLALLLFCLAAIVWSIVDAAVRPDSAWQASGNSKVVWLVVLIFVPLVSLFLVYAVLAGGLLSLVYLVFIRRRVAASQV